MGCGPSCSSEAPFGTSAAHVRSSPRPVRVWPALPRCKDASGFRSSQGFGQDSCGHADDTAARPDSAFEASSVAFELPDVHSLHPLRVTVRALSAFV